MIIWGTKRKVTPVGQGMFFCPKCRNQSSYSLIRVARCFHIYFIAIGSGTTLGQYVVCHTCHGEFNQDVLSLDAAAMASVYRVWECPICRNQNPGGNDECLKCHRWRCANCQNDNPSSMQECLRCRSPRGSAFSAY